jgi:hypothetical protein
LELVATKNTTKNTTKKHDYNTLQKQKRIEGKRGKAPSLSGDFIFRP